VWHDSFICVTWLIHMCDMTHSYVWHDSFICVTWLLFECVTCLIHAWHDSFIRDSVICVTWLIHICDMTHSYMTRHHTGLIVTHWFICVTWLTCMCDMTRSYAWHDSFICVTWLIYMCDMTHTHLINDLNGIQFLLEMGHTWMNCATYEMRHVTYVSYEMRHVTHVTYEMRHVTWFISHMKWDMLRMTRLISYVTDSHLPWLISYVTWRIHMGDMKWATHEWIVLHMEESCHAYKKLCRTYTWATHVYTFICIHSCICATWLFHMRETWLFRMCVA